MQIIVQPLPRINLTDIQPRLSIRQRRKEPKSPNHHRQNNPRSRPRGQETLTGNALADRSVAFLLLLFGAGFAVFDGEVGEVVGLDIEDEFDDCARHKRRSKVSGQVVVEEELAAHYEEGNVVGCPEEEEEACAVVEAGAGACGNVSDLL